MDNWPTSTGHGQAIHSVALQADGKILLGGDFTILNGMPRYRIARLLPDGTVESTATFNPETGAGSTVFSVAIQSDGKILLGGFFGIVRLLQNGTVESTATFNPDVGGGGVYGVASQADGKILLVGDFTSVNGQPRNGVARLLPDGRMESTITFNPGTGLNGGGAYSVAVQTDGRILVGGYFTGVNGQPRNGIARLRPDGTVESTSALPCNVTACDRYENNPWNLPVRTCRRMRGRE